jgi:hypothetical protein
MDGERGSNVPNRGLPPVYKVIVNRVQYLNNDVISLEDKKRFLMDKLIL